MTLIPPLPPQPPKFPVSDAIITIHLNETQYRYLCQLRDAGIFGDTHADIVHRALDALFLEKLSTGFLGEPSIDDEL